MKATSGMRWINVLGTISVPTSLYLEKILKGIKPCMVHIPRHDLSQLVTACEGLLSVALSAAEMDSIPSVDKAISRAKEALKR